MNCFFIIQNALYQTAQYFNQDKNDHKKKLIAEVKKYVQDNYQRQLTLSLAADAVFYQPVLFIALVLRGGGLRFYGLCGKGKGGGSQKAALQ